MKFVIITGSSRNDSNTKRMAASFEGAAYIKALATGQQVSVKNIDASQLNIGLCQACDTCFSTGKPCSYDDDFNTVADAILEADGIVIAAPVYWYGLPASVKLLMDKCYSFYNSIEKRFEGKKAALLSCCGDEDSSTFDGIKFEFEKSMEIMSAEVVGEVLVAGVYPEGAVKSTSGIDQAAQLINKFM
ncbi:MAG: NAD(P)H-dependent oxidoreductase [Bacillota bacterium]|nr:NAD(P)H-dependent oxidoreductase [Bacillota bacterium]